MGEIEANDIDAAAGAANDGPVAIGSARDEEMIASAEKQPARRPRTNLLAAFMKRHGAAHHHRRQSRGTRAKAEIQIRETEKIVWVE